jgi:hypothetical protein
VDLPFFACALSLLRESQLLSRALLLSLLLLRAAGWSLGRFSGGTFKPEKKEVSYALLVVTAVTMRGPAVRPAVAVVAAVAKALAAVAIAFAAVAKALAAFARALAALA